MKGGLPRLTFISTLAPPTWKAKGTSGARQVSVLAVRVHACVGESGHTRITGLRLPHQQPDGTFTAGKSRTVTVDIPLIREMLLDDEARAHLFPGLETELRSARHPRCSGSASCPERPRPPRASG